MTETFDYSLSKVVDAPVATVWQVWTEANHYETWFHAAPGSVSLDVRPGGAFAAMLNTPDGSQVPITGSYREVEKNERLVTAMDMPDGTEALMNMRLRDLGGKTEITLAQSCRSAEERDMSSQGSELLLEWCAEYVESR